MATLISAKNPVLKAGVHYVTSPFGNRTYEINGKQISEFHQGLDLVGKNIAADYICAIDGGVIDEVLSTVTGSTPSQGNFVSIYHGNNLYSVYYHLAYGTSKVKAGDRIEKGAVIGYMGSTGNSTGAHLHLGIQKNGVWLDPMPYVTGEKEITEKLPDPSKGELSGVNIGRKENMLVLYTGMPSTLTNEYGWEVLLDKNGVALTEPVYGEGNMTIPSGCRALSGHGVGGKWLSDTVKKGNLVWTEAGKVKVSQKLYRSVQSKNGTRTENALVIYDKGEKAKTNPYGTELTVSKDGTVLTDPIYGKGETPIPAGGYVLSGHGTESVWLKENIRKGQKITVGKTGKYIFVE